MTWTGKRDPAKRLAIVALLEANDGLSNREIARRLGVHHQLVGNVRWLARRVVESESSTHQVDDSNSSLTPANVDQYLDPPKVDDSSVRPSLEASHDGWSPIISPDGVKAYVMKRGSA
jgi:hypothetical protein